MIASNIPLATIPKESIPSLRFGASDVISDPTERRKRLASATRAAVLGNGYRSKVDITFQTADGQIQRVSTTIWAFDQDYVLLKSSTAIPLRCILNIESC
ncbi:MAG: hypothetical protein LPJ89_08185 [Hymenobacteraceae bacterium]|nr:hypothetical protein [Hymenobacteraceae bacterium]MDX5395838.1 hypothetical protein [Hymenobacteraceae bacterium]MDX5443742.1 hypothetical protein [Hymenobacteraceae bacterium]MDX5511893.1 hypothetical protein [Hymenobacteraceae bacterium]